MPNKKDIFNMTKTYYKTALDNFELYQKNNENMMKIFFDQYGDINGDFMKHYEEWLTNSHKAFDDYRKPLTTTAKWYLTASTIWLTTSSRTNKLSLSGSKTG